MNYQYEANELDNVLKRFDEFNTFNESEFFAHQLQIATLIRLDTLSDRLLTIAFALERLNEIQGSRQ